MDDSIDRGGRVLIHGSDGNSRASFVAMAWMMSKEGMNYNQAWFHLKTCWPSANPNSGFLIQLRKIEENLKKSNPNFGKTVTFPEGGRSIPNVDEQADQYENTMALGAGFDNTQRNEPSTKVNTSAHLKGPHTNFWDPESKTYGDKKQTFRYLPNHNLQYIGQNPLDMTTSNKYWTKNEGCISPLKPKYEQHKSSYEAKQELNERYSRKGIQLAKDSIERCPEVDEDRGLHVYPIHSNGVGRGPIKREQVNRDLLRKKGEHLKITSFKNGNFGF